MTTAVDRQLVGPAELQHMLGVGRQRVFQLAAGKTFPPPVAVLRMGNVWDLDDIRRWAAQAGRTLGELPAGWPTADEAGKSNAPS